MRWDEMFGAYRAPLVEDVGDKVDKIPVALLVNWQVTHCCQILP
jgi:hypothetical protein